MKDKINLKEILKAAKEEIKAVSITTFLIVIIVLLVSAFAIDACILNQKIDTLNESNIQSWEANQKLEEANKKLDKDIKDKEKDLKDKDEIIKSKDEEIAQKEAENDALADDIIDKIDKIEIGNSSTSRSDSDLVNVRNSFTELENLVRDAIGYTEKANAIVDALNKKADDYEDILDRYPDYRPTVGEITSPFGYRVHPITGKTKFHKGVDLDNVTGTAIWASAKGIVTFAGYDGSYGYSIVIDHGNGFQTRYAHLSEMISGVGDEVEKGELIGRMGASGNVTGDHLHFEVIKNGNRVNPMNYIPR